MHIEVFIHAAGAKPAVATVKSWWVRKDGTLAHHTLLDRAVLPGGATSDDPWSLLSALYAELRAARDAR